MNSSGGIEVATNWTPNIDLTFENAVSAADTLNIGLDAGNAPIAATIANTIFQEMNHVTINLTDGATLSVGSRFMKELTLNISNGSQFFATSGNTRFGTAATINYYSAAESVSSVVGNKFRLQSDTSVLNMYDGKMVVNEFQSTNNGELNLEGGDFSFAVKNFNVNQVGNINFNSIAGSVLTFTGATSIDDLNTELEDGFIQIDSATVGLSAYKREFDGNELRISVIPEPGTYALLAGFAAFGSIMLRRRR